MSELPFRQQVSLKSCNTLAIDVRARYLLQVCAPEQIPAAVAFAGERQLPLLVLGGGSNVVLSGDFPGVVLQIALRGIEVEDAGNGADILLRVAGGENWHQLVEYCLQQGYHGLENLALIPGTAGAAPIQNIGAYGVELSRFLHAVRGVKIDGNRALELSAEQCEPGYRDSVFKHALRDNFIVTEVVLKLHGSCVPAIDYPALREQLQVQPPLEGESDALRIERAVRAIRRSKLPDPARWPNAGSFFKNPVIPPEQFAALRQRYPDLPHYAAAGGVKIPAAWLIERCGWKGRRLGSVGVHDRQALVLIHYGGGDAGELLALAGQIQRDVTQRYGVALELEPGVYGD